MSIAALFFGYVVVLRMKINQSGSIGRSSALLTIIYLIECVCMYVSMCVSVCVCVCVCDHQVNNDKVITMTIIITWHNSVIIMRLAVLPTFLRRPLLPIGFLLVLELLDYIRKIHRYRECKSLFSLNKL